MRVSLARVAFPALLLLPWAVGSASAAAEPSGPEWIEGDYTFAFASFGSVAVTGSVDVRRITIDDRRYDADELRAAYEGLSRAGPEAQRSFIAAVERLVGNRVRANLEAAFPGAALAPARADVVEASLAAAPDSDPTSPPVRIAIGSEVEVDLEHYGVEGYTFEDLDAVLDAGAGVEVPISLFADPGHENAFAIDFPSGVWVREADVAHTRTRATMTVENLLGTSEKAERHQVVVGAAGRDPPSVSDGALRVTLDIRDLDVTVGGAAAGDFGDLIMEITTRAELVSVVVPEGMKEDLPAGLRLDALTADGLRILLERGLVTREDLDEGARGLLDLLRDDLAGALGAPATGVVGGFDAASLSARLVSGDGGTPAPVVFEARATVVRPIQAGAPAPTAAVSLYTISQRLPLSRIGAFDTFYTIVLPRGIAVAAASADGAPVSVVNRPDGRDEMTVALAGDGPSSTSVAVQFAVTPTFVLAKFWPIVALAALVLLVVVTWVVVKVTRAIRR